MTPEEFQRAFKPVPIYVFAGEEDFYKIQGIAQIRSALLKEDADQLGFTPLEANEVDMATVLDELRTFTLFSRSRVILLERADAFFGLKSKGGTADSEEDEAQGEMGKAKTHRELLLKYLDAPVAGSSLVITTQKTWGQLKKLTEKVTRAGFLVECKPPFESRIPGWLVQRAQHHGKRMETRAAQSLAREGGKTLLQLDLQLAKLVTYVGERPEITEADVKDVVGHAGHESIFALTEAAASQNPGRALGVLRDLLLYGQTEPAIIGMLAWQFRRLWQAKKLQNAGAHPPDIAKELNLRPFFVHEFMKQLHQFSETDLRRSHRLLLEADVATKSGSNPQVVVEQLVIQLCRPPSRP